MKAVLLVGGEGTRLHPLTYTVPKPMVPVLNRPFLEYVLRHLCGYDITNVFLAIHHLPEKIQEHFGDGSETKTGVVLEYIREPHPLGTAGAVKNLEEHLSETFVVCNGDVFTDLDLGAAIAFHRSKGAQATIVLTPVEDATPFGLVETEPSGRVSRFVEKPKKHPAVDAWVNAGTYILEPEILKYVPSGEHYMFERGLFPALLDMGAPLYAFHSRAYWRDIGTPQMYLQVHYDLLMGEVSMVPNGREIVPGVWVEGGCSIDSTARLDGPLLLGSGTVVDPGAVLEGPAVLGRGCRIASGARISGAVLWDNVQVGMGSALSGCVVGEGVIVERDVVLGKGCLIADGVVIGTGNCLENGTVLSPGRYIKPMSLGGSNKI